MLLSRLRGAHAPLIALLGVALLLRALVPAGWMPTRDADGVAITLCSGILGDPAATEAANAVLQAALAGSASAGDHEEEAPGHKDLPPCAFASLTPFTPAAQLAEPAPPATSRAPSLPFALLEAVGRGLPAPPPPATGPPHHA